MGIIDKPLESISEQDLLDLVANQVREIENRVQGLFAEFDV